MNVPACSPSAASPACAQAAKSAIRGRERNETFGRFASASDTAVGIAPNSPALLGQSLKAIPQLGLSLARLPPALDPIVDVVVGLGPENCVW